MPPIIFPFELNQLYDHWVSPNEWLECNIDISALIAVPALLVALLIPLALFMLGEKKMPLLIDEKVLVEKVINAEPMFISFLVLGFIPFFWKILNFQSVLLVAMLVCVVIIVRSFIFVYRWFSVIEPENHPEANFRAKMRYEYLKGLKPSEKIVAWSQVWADKKTQKLKIDERELIPIFMTTLSNTQNSPYVSRKLLEDFVSNISVLNLNDPIIHKYLLEYCVDWQIDFYNTDELDFDIFNYEIHGLIGSLYSELLEHDVNNSMNMNILFSQIISFLKHTNRDVTGFFEFFSKDLMSRLTTQEKADHIWKNFPPQWKISLENLSNDENRYFVGIWYHAYLGWILNRRIFAMNSNDESYDILSDITTRELLPNVDPITWSLILIFQFISNLPSEVKGKNKIWKHINNYLNMKLLFGGLGRAYGFWGDNGGNALENQYQAQVKNERSETVNLVLKLNFAPIFVNPELAKKYVEEIKKFDNLDERQESKLQSLKYTFSIFFVGQLFDD